MAVVRNIFEERKESENKPIRNIFEEQGSPEIEKKKDEPKQVTPEQAQKRQAFEAKVFPTLTAVKNAEVKPEQPSLRAPKEGETFTGEKEGFFTKLKKAVLPRSLEIKLGITDPQTTGEIITANEGARQSYYRQKQSQEYIAEQLKGVTIPEAPTQEPGLVGTLKNNWLTSWNASIEAGWIGGTLEQIGAKVGNQELKEFGQRFADNAVIDILKHPEWTAFEYRFTEGGYKDPHWYAQTMGQLLPSIAGTLGAATVGGFLAGPTGAVTSGGAFIFSLESGNAYRDMVQKGIAPDTASEAAGVYGVVSTMLEGINFIRIGNRVIGGQQLQTIKNSYKATLLKELPKTVGIEAGTEGSQQLAQNIITKFFNDNQDMWEDVIESTAAGAVGGLGFGGVQVGFKSVKDIQKYLGKEQTATKAPTKAPKVTQETQETSPDPTGATETSVQGVTSVQDVFGTQTPTEAQIRTKSADLVKELARSEQQLNSIDRGILPGDRRAVIDASNALRTLFVQFAEATKMTTAELKSGNAVPLYQVEVVPLSDGTFLQRSEATISNVGFGRPFSFEKAYATKEEAAQAGAQDVRAWVEQQLARNDTSKQAQKELQKINADLAKRYDTTTDTADIEQTDATETIQELKDVIADLMTPEEALTRTVEDLNGRWNSVASFVEREINTPFRGELAILNDRLALTKGKKNRAQKGKIENRIKEINEQIAEAQKLIDEDNFSFQEQLYQTLYQRAQASGVAVEQEAYVDQLSSALYEQPEAFWEKKVSEVADFVNEQNGGAKMKEGALPFDIVEDLRAYVSVGTKEGHKIKDATIEELKKSPIGIEELTFENDTITLYRTGDMVSGRAQSYSLTKQDGREAFVIPKENVLAYLGGDTFRGAVEGAYTPEVAEGKVDALDTFKNLEDEVLAITPDGITDTEALTGEYVATYAEETGTDGGFADFLLDQIRSEDYEKKTVSIDELRKNDEDLEGYLSNTDEIREFEGDPFSMDPIVSSTGEVLDGYNRISQAIADGKKEIEVFSGIKKKTKKQATEPQKESVQSDVQQDIQENFEEDIPLETAVLAFEGLSFKADQRGAQARKDYSEGITEMRQQFEKDAVSDEQKKILDDMIEKYRQKRKELYISYLNASSRTMSTMITGAGNFPVARNQKRMRIRDDKLSAIVDHTKTTEARIAKALKRQSVEDAGGAKVVAQTELEQQKEMLDAMKEANKIIKNKKLTDAQKIEQIAKLPQHTEKIAQELLKPDFANRLGWASFQLTSIRNKIKRLEASVTKEETKETATDEDIEFFSVDGARVVTNAKEDRIKILFDGKPDDAMRTLLKSKGWRWSPNAGAWQRKLTPDAKYSARRFIFGDVEKIKAKPADKNIITITPEDLAKADIKKGRSNIGNLEVRKLDIDGTTYDVPKQLVTKTQLKDILGGEERVDFIVAEERFVKYLTHKTETSNTALRATALGLVDDKLEAGMIVRVDAKVLKEKGTALRAVNERGDTIGFALKKKTPEQIKQETENEMKKVDEFLKKEYKLMETEPLPPQKKDIRSILSNLTAKVWTRKGQNEVEKIIKRSEIADALSKAIGAPIRRGKFQSSRALGVFKTRANVVRVKERGSGGLPTVFHEIGHALDYMVYNFRDKIAKDELRPLTEEYGGPLKTNKRLREEAFAEFLRYYLTDPDRAKATAPQFFATFEETMKDLPEIFEVLKTARVDFMRWKQQPATAKVLSQISFEDPDGKTVKEKFFGGLDKLYELSVNDLHPLAKFTAKAEQELGKKLESKDNPYILARLMRGWVGKAEMFLEHGTFGRVYWKEEGGSVQPSYTGRGLREILKDIDDRGALNDFRVYLVAKRAVELAERKIVTGIEKTDAQEAVTELESKHPDFITTQKELVKYQDSLIEYGTQNGLFDRKTKIKMRELNKEYVPFYRVHDELVKSGYMGKGFGDVAKPTKRIKGSEREILDPLESIVKNTYALINASERNQVGIAMSRLAALNPKLGQVFEQVPLSQAKVATVKGEEFVKKAFGGEFEQSMLPVETQMAIAEIENELVDIFRPAMFEKGSVLTVLVDGKKKAFQVDPDLYGALQSLEAEQVALIVKLFSYPAKFLRAGATLAPDFMVRNPLRDQMTAMVFSQYGFTPGIDVVRGIFSALKQDDAYRLWKMSGGEHAMLVSMDRQKLQQRLDDVLAGKVENVKNVVKNPLKLLQILSQYSEIGTRLGEMRKGLKKSRDPLASAFASREVSLDFSRIGAKIRVVNMLIAFFNPVVQGNDKLVRSFRDNPYRTTVKTMFGITLPSILLYLLNRDEEGWDEIPQWQKDLFWLVKVGDTWYRIPKPFELGVLFGSVPERVIEYLDKRDPRMLDEVFVSVKDAVAPSFLPTFMLPWIENYTNYSFFMDRPIVPVAKQDLPAEEQYTNNTSEVSKLLGDLINYSPAKIDNLLYGYFATLGRYAVQGVDAVLEGTNITNTVPAPEKTKADIPVLKAFVVRDPVGSGSMSIDNFYSKREEATQARNKYKMLIDEKRLDEANAYIAEHPEIEVAKFYDKVARELSEIRSVRTQIEQSPDLTPKEKREKMNELDKIMTDLAHQAINMQLRDGTK